MRRVRFGAGAVVLAGALLLGACSSSPTSMASSRTPSTATSVRGTQITISNFAFSPMVLTVSPGATISVTNKDPVTHTLTATGGQFNTGDIASHQTKTFKAPMKAGTYNYICGIHQYMMGAIKVK